MDILPYLSELIQTHKVVGVSGLGTVYKKKSPGRYDAETHSFVPPSYTLNFTPEVKEEVLLADFISKKRSIPTDTANYFINEFSTGILQQLNHRQEASLGTLGKLYKADDELHFEPSEKLNYGFDFYGLPIVRAEQEPSAEEIMPETPPVIEETVHDPEQEILPFEIPAAEDTVHHLEAEVLPHEAHHIEEPVHIPVQEHTIETVVPDNEHFIQDHSPAPKKTEQQLRAEIEALNFYRSKSPVSKPTLPEQQEAVWDLKSTETPEPAKFHYPEEEVYVPEEEEEEKVKTTPLYLKVILSLLVLAIMTAISYVVKPEWFNGILKNTPSSTQKSIEQTKQPVPVTPKADSTLATDTLKKSVPSTTPKQAVTKDDVVKTPDTAIVYEVMAASLRNQKEADYFIERMKRSGISAKVITNMPGRRLKISIATLKDEESAMLELKRLSRKLKIPGIYIYKNKQ